MKNPVEIRPLPAFYGSPTYPDHIWWVDRSGEVVNGAWDATFNADRSEAWCDWRKLGSMKFKKGQRTESEHFVWLASAPSRGDYNGVINKFIADRAKRTS